MVWLGAVIWLLGAVLTLAMLTRAPAQRGNGAIVGLMCGLWPLTLIAMLVSTLIDWGME